MSELVGRLLNRRYRMEASLGRGGMAEVYKVWDEERATYLALKLLREDLAEDQVFLRRFKREAQTLAKLQHPNIVRFYGLEQEGPLAFILMDYIEGRSLRREIFDARGPLSPQRVLEIMQSVCAALYYAHQKGFVHCDIKPGNVLIDKKGTVYLTDFGIARMTESATATMVGAGTPAYMAPEQARGEDPTPQTDIYALGVVLFEMLTSGERPFTGEHAKTGGSTSEKVRWEQMNLRPPSPRKFNPKISSKLEAVVLKCLEKEPEQRYQSALELLNAVIAAVKEEDIKHEEVKRQVKEKKTETKEEARAPAQPPASPPAAMIPRKYQSAIVIGVMLSIVAMIVAVVTGIRYLEGLGRLSGGSVPTLITLQLPVANVPSLQTFTSSPTITLTPTSTSLPTSTPKPRATVNSDPTLYDNFNNTNFDGSFNSLLWEKNGDSFFTVEQRGGTLVFTNSTSPNAGDFTLRLRQPDRRTLDHIRFFEAKLKISDDIQGGMAFVKIQIVTNVQNHTWWTQCRLQGASGSTAIFICDVYTVTNDNFNVEYTTESITVNYNSWYKARIEIEPVMFTLHFYLDDTLIASYTPNDSAFLINASFVPQVGVWNNDANTYATRYVDDVWITP
jgi:serine/threonine protein kinase